MKSKRFWIIVFIGVSLISAALICTAQAKKAPYISNGVPYGG